MNGMVSSHRLPFCPSSSTEGHPTALPDELMHRVRSSQQVPNRGRDRGPKPAAWHTYLGPSEVEEGERRSVSPLSEDRKAEAFS